MFDIDKYLDGITLKEMQPGDDVVTKAKKRCEEEQARRSERKQAIAKVKKGMMIAVPGAAVLLIGVLIGAALFSKTVSEQPQAVAYYTVDVNPSLRVRVDGDNLVTGVTGQNDDADAIVKKLDCVGRPAADAIHEIVAAIKDAGYFSEGPRYVLIGCFASDGTQVSGTLTDLQTRLEADFGDMINLLIVSGSLEDFAAADELKVSPGLLKLARMADGIEVTDGENVEDIVSEVQSKTVYCAPELTATPAKDGVILKWDELDFHKMGYGSKVRYVVAMGDTADEVSGMKASPIKTFGFYAYDTQTTTYKVTGLEPGQTKYFAIYAYYGETAVCSNVASAAMPEAQPAEPPRVSAEPDPVKTEAPAISKAPEPAEMPQPAHSVSGRVSGEKVVLSWAAETAENFQGYKVVASKTNPNPKYPDDGYIKYITERDKTSLSAYAGSYGLKGGAEYYFSVTYLFTDGSAVAGNAVKLKVPVKTAEPEPTAAPTDGPAPPPPGDYASSSISGGITDSTISLSWERISDERFDGYKVVASFSNPNPRYPDDGYLYYITDCADTGKSFNVSKLGGFTPGATCYFSITVLYNDGTKKAGNAISLAMPAAAAPPPADYASTDIGGSMDADGTLHLHWGAISDSRLEGYKVMYSFTSSSPVYGSSGDYAAWITDGGTSYSGNIIGLNGYAPGGTCYFSISALYDGHSVVKPGNTISFTAP